METIPTPTPSVLSDDQRTRDRKNSRRRELRKQKAAERAAAEQAKAAAEQAKAEYEKVRQSIYNKRSYCKTKGDNAGVAEATRELESLKANTATFIAQKTQEILSTMNPQNNGTPQGTPMGAPPPTPPPRPLPEQFAALGRPPTEVEVLALHTSYENDAQRAVLSQGFAQFTTTVASLNSPSPAHPTHPHVSVGGARNLGSDLDSQVHTPIYKEKPPKAVKRTTTPKGLGRKRTASSSNTGSKPPPRMLSGKKARVFILCFFWLVFVQTGHSHNIYFSTFTGIWYAKTNR